MASLIPGYEYDIFISYRQKDNKHDGWVTEFVDNLKGELESTFKEEVSVYFDINPHNGLLETHDVDESLKEKLKCLVFIPIISRTYCDPKSFAWEHEFKAFVEQASKDQYGLKVKLPNGNVASRVLPVHIHDIDNEDTKLCESVLGGVLRGVKFIYKSPGINRSLRAKEDKPHENLNNTIYLDQINKVALAIREIISVFTAQSTESYKDDSSYSELLKEVRKDEEMEWHRKPSKLSVKKFISGIFIVAILVIAAIVIYPKIFKGNILERIKTSGEKMIVVIMPFQNLTNDTLWNVWQNGIQSELITYLTNSEEIKVRQQGTTNSLLQSKGLTNYASITPSFSQNIAQKLEANILVSGNINKAGNIIRINTQLIEAKTGDIIKSFQIESSAQEEKIFNIIDSISSQIKSFLIISKMQEDEPGIKYSKPTNSVEGYRYFMYGQKAFNNSDFKTAINYYNQALAIDTNFYSAITMISTAYYNIGMYDQAKEWILKVYKSRDQMPVQQRIHVNWLHALLFETPKEEIKYLLQLLEIDDQNYGLYYELGRIYVGINQYDNAISSMNKVFEIYKKLGIKPRWVQDYIMLGYAYQKTSRYKKEKRLFKKAEKEYPDNMYLLQRQAILSLTEKDTIDANIYLDKYKSILQENSVTEADIYSSLAYIYKEGGYLDKAEDINRKALSLQPDNPYLLNSLAWFLIDQARNVQEGLELIEKARELNIDEYYYVDCKGYGLLKLGKYEEALKYLEKSDSLKPRYDHVLFLHLEEAKKALANQKNN